MDSEKDSESHKGSPMQKFRSIFRGFGPIRGRPTRCTNCSKSLSSRWLAMASAEPRRNRLRALWPLEEKLLRQFCGWSMASPATTRSAGYFLCSRPRSFEECSGGSWQPSPRPMGSSSPERLPSMERRCGCGLRAGQSSTAAAYGHVFATGGADGAGLAQGAGRNEGQGSVGSTSHAVARRLYRYRSMRCIATGPSPRPCQARRPLRAGLKGNQGKLFDAVARRFARAGIRSVAKRIELSTHDRCESRRATVHSRPPAWPPQNHSPASWPWLAYLAQTRSDQSVPRAGRALLPAFQVPLRQAIAATPCAVIGESRTSCIGFSMVVSTKTVRDQKRQRPENLAILRDLRSISSAAIPTDLHAPKSQTRRAGTTHPSRPPHPHAIALP